MTDLPSSLGIEAVECVSEGGRSLTVRVTGRWRRRRPELRGQAVLVVETEAGRQRFPAMPEPPSLTGAAPGTWRMSFSVPAALAPSLPGRTFLQLGGVLVPIPIGEVTIAAEGAEGPGADLLEARRARGSELAAESARRRAATLAAEVERLESELGEARARSDRLRDDIAEGERRLRGAEQHAHAERALRVDLEQELARRTRSARHDLGVLHDRVAELERELSVLRRGLDEAGHLAAAAEAARAVAEAGRAEAEAGRAEAEAARAEAESGRAEAEAGRAEAEAARAEADAVRSEAERRLAFAVAEPMPAEPAPPEPAPPEPAPPPTDSARAEQTRRELDLDRASRALPSHAVSPRPVERSVDRATLGIETGMVRRRGERAAPERADPRVAELERELATVREEAEAQHRRSARAYEAIELVRAELRELRASPPTPPPPGPMPQAPAPAATTRPPATPSPATPSPATPSPATPPPASPVEAERLSEALARLRERTPPVEPDPDDPTPVDATPEPDPAEPAPDPAPARPAHLGHTPVDRLEPTRAARPWLHSAFRRLAAQDASAAGRLVLALLPAQRAADPQPVAYDLVLSDVLVAHVTSDSLAVHVEHDATPRPPSELDFQLVGDLASVARLLRAGGVRRRLRVPPGRMARVRGDWRRLAALDRLIDARLTVRELSAAGVTPDPMLAFSLAGLMIEPAWTAGERFIIGHRESAAAPADAYLHIRDGRPPLATAETPHGPVATVLESPADDVLGALVGPPAQLVGDLRPLALLRQWLDRAQSG